MLNSKKQQQKLKKLKSSINLRYWLIGLLLIGTATVTTNLFSWSMMALTGFFLAYISKGMRNKG